MLEKLDELNLMFDELSITPKVNKPQFYMASVHDESLGFAANIDHIQQLKATNAIKKF